MDSITKRFGVIIEFGNSVGITLRNELLDVGLAPGDTVLISVVKDKEKKKIIIEKKDTEAIQ